MARHTNIARLVYGGRKPRATRCRVWVATKWCTSCDAPLKDDYSFKTCEGCRRRNAKRVVHPDSIQEQRFYDEDRRTMYRAKGRVA